MAAECADFWFNSLIQGAGLAVLSPLDRNTGPSPIPIKLQPSSLMILPVLTNKNELMPLSAHIGAVYRQLRRGGGFSEFPNHCKPLQTTANHCKPKFRLMGVGDALGSSREAMMATLLPATANHRQPLQTTANFWPLMPASSTHCRQTPTRRSQPQPLSTLADMDLRARG